jgi:hypothetical protein
MYTHAYKKISSKLKIYPPPHQKSNGPSLNSKIVIAYTTRKYGCTLRFVNMAVDYDS